jgi:hypothetical protein
MALDLTTAIVSDLAGRVSVLQLNLRTGFALMPLPPNKVATVMSGAGTCLIKPDMLRLSEKRCCMTLWSV